MDFLGHKKSLLDFVLRHVCAPAAGRQTTVVDLFAGTGTVSAAIKERGHRVVANDHLRWCSLLTEARLLNDASPPFRRLLAFLGAGRRGASPYERVLAFLEGIEPAEGFIFTNYTPASARAGGTPRMYFSEENGGRIDATRRTIELWRPLLTSPEYALLVSTVVLAAAEVANIAGTFGCYLKHWKARALVPLRLRPLELQAGRATGHVVHCEDAQQLAPRLSARIVYADPPYTKRQYAAYYHVLETIAVGDAPEIEGSTGLRPWKQQSSPYCYRRKAPGALTDLVDRLDCRHFFLSYNEDGQIPHEQVLDILAQFGTVRFTEIEYRRYKSSTLPHKGNVLRERIYHLERAA